ncbi:MAG: roadblock/LC7 domain-containing protein [Methanobacterium sp.]|uniref:roadblock/LC7 domain-containing protein n=1 Tax=Methanobacterium sp. TaxID=2164 RepID=UPI003D64E662|nr:roadblock/LC7 domain-containing protein [Methanobacterium sp.]
MDADIENQLIRILSDLNKINGIESSLIADSNGNVMYHSMSRGTDTALFGSMAHVITGSSKRLLKSANQGKIERVLVESHGGKALFLHLGNVHFIVLMEISANVGLVMVSAKRIALQIVEITKDMVPIEPIEEIIEAPPEEKVPVTSKTEVPAIIEAEAAESVAEVEIEASDISDEIKEETPVEVTEEKLEPVEEIKAEIEIEESADVSDEIKIEEIEEEIAEPEIESEAKPEEIEPVKEEIPEPVRSIPTIKPPISFPKLPEDVKIPSGDKEKSDLILDIYESIFLAMSIGASRIMGVSPARGLIKKFLPLEDCKSLLNGVDVKSNSLVDFVKIKENSENIPLKERETVLINNFSKIIEIITENYGKVMGYGAFRGIVRPEFKVISDSYGEAMDKLGIKEKIHPELAELFQ